MDTQYLFWMVLLAPLTNGVITWLLRATNHNTRKTSIVIGLATLAMFLSSWLYVADNFASWTPAWIVTAVLFWIGWHQLTHLMNEPGASVIPSPDFFSPTAEIEIVGSWQMIIPGALDSDFDELCHVALIRNLNTSDARLIRVQEMITPGRYTPKWDEGIWKFFPRTKIHGTSTTH